MNPLPDDLRINAYVRGELTPDAAEAVEHAAATHPAVREKIQEAREIERFLRERLTTATAQLQSRQRQNTRRSTQSSFTGTSIQPWLIPAAAAAVLVIATFIMVRMPDAKPKPATAPQPAAVGSEKPPEPASPEAKLQPPSVDDAQISIFTAGAAALELPILPKKADLSTIIKSIVTDRELPRRELIRPEEIINHLTLRLHGTAAIARNGSPPSHADHRDSAMHTPVATVSTETIACPWKPSATLLLINIRSAGQTDSNVNLTFRPDPTKIASYRLLGFPSKFGAPRGRPPTLLPANSSTTLALEIESTKPGTEMAMLEWSANGHPAPSISIKHKSDSEPSDDARFASLLCTWALWLAGEQPSIIDRELVLSLTRENSSASLSTDRAELMKLIERSMKL